MLRIICCPTPYSHLQYLQDVSNPCVSCFAYGALTWYSSALSVILLNRHAFFSFLQLQWHSFIQEMDGSNANCIVPFAHPELYQQALAQIRTHPDVGRRWFHWGMALMAFPQFKTTSTILGRLLAVQGDVRLAQVQQRLYEQLGHRSTLERASQRVLSSMVDSEQNRHERRVRQKRKRLRSVPHG